MLKRERKVRLAAILLVALCAQVFLPAPSFCVAPAAAENALDTSPAFGAYINHDYTGIYEFNNPAVAHNAEQAAQAAVNMNLCDDPAELKLERTASLGSETFYQFQQIYQTMRVWGHRVMVLTDSQGTVLAISGDCVPVGDLNARQADWNALAQAATDWSRSAGLLSRDSALSSEDMQNASELVVYADDRTPRLACLVDGSILGSSTAPDILLDTETGELLDVIDNQLSTAEMTLDAYPWQAEFPCDENGEYLLRDEARCFEIYDAEGYLVVPLITTEDDDPLIEKQDYVEKNVFEALFDRGPAGLTYSEGLIDKPVSLYDPEDADAYARDVYASAALAYDYFHEVLGWDGFNGARANIKIVYNSKGIPEGNTVSTDNAIMYPGENAGILVYLDDAGREYASNPNTGVHEYSHGVEQTISGIVSDGDDEGSGVREALSDAFAELAEAYATDRDPDWTNAVRSCYPSGTDTLFHYADYADGTDGHASSTIATYSLYQLWWAWRDSMPVEECMEKMSHLLFRALFLLPNDASFYDLAYAVRTSGRIMERNGDLSLKQYDQLCESLQNVGLLKQESTCIIEVTDPDGVPIENALVALFTGEDSDAPVLEDNDLNGGMSLITLRTSDAGLCHVRLFDDGASYRIAVQADGYEPYSGWMDTIVEQTDSADVQFLVNRIELWPEGSEPGEIPVAEFDDGLLWAELERLAEQYGTVGIGESRFANDQTETPIPAERLCGLLGADVYDYDGDGQNELLVIRLDTSPAQAQGAETTHCVISVYDWNANMAAVDLAGELTFGLPMTNAFANAAFHFARGESSEGAALYAEYFYDFNSRGFGTLRIAYDGTLNVTGGVECDEFYAWCSCHRALSNEALQNLLSPQMALDGAGWEQSGLYDWEGKSAEPSQDDLDAYSACYGDLLAEIQLENSESFSMWINPARPTLGEYSPEQPDAYQQRLQALAQYEFELAAEPFDQRYHLTDGTLQALCGVSRSVGSLLGSSDITLSCYDTGEALSSFR